MNNYFNLSVLMVFFTLLLNLLPHGSKAQIAFYSSDNLEKIKEGTTYIVVKEPDFQLPEAYIDIVKKYWTFSKIEFIKYNEVKDHIRLGNSFFMFGGYVLTKGISTYTYVYLSLWTPDEKYFKKEKKKAFETYDQLELARIELFTDYPTLEHPETVYKDEFDEYEHIRNWGPGFLKNYLQQLMDLFKKGEERLLTNSVLDQNKIKTLAQETLYVPDYALIHFKKWGGDESTRTEEKALFKDYPFKYQLISNDELNEKILKAEQPFYYLVYVKSSTDKYISVVNAQTGELIYSQHDYGYNLESKDLQKLADTIRKKK